MPNSGENPYAALEKVFHEPSRLAIMSALANAAHGVIFRELRDKCNLTDGNLSRHLKTLEEAGMVKIKKAFVGARPQTTAVLTSAGRKSFIDYLKALEEVLQKAAASLKTDPKAAPISGLSPKMAKG